MGTPARTNLAAVAAMLLAAGTGCIRTTQDVQRDYAQKSDRCNWAKTWRPRRRVPCN